MGPEPIDAFTTKLLAAESFSGVVSVRLGGRLLLERAAGLADRSNRIQNAVDTRFATASGTKLLTALAIGRLIDAGRLSLDTRVVDCLPPGVPYLRLHQALAPDY